MDSDSDLFQEIYQNNPENTEFSMVPDSSAKSLDQIEPYDTFSERPRDISTRSKRTRSRSKFEKQTLYLFKDKNNRNPKKEYLRVQIIRGVKRTIREALLS